MNKKILLLWAISFTFLPGYYVYADGAPAPVSIHLNVEGPTSTLFSGDVTVPACATPNNPTPTVNGLCAFDAAGLAVASTTFSFGVQIDAIAGVASGAFPDSWLWFLNGDIAQVGIDSYLLQPGDTILWAITRQPLKVSLSTATPKVGATTTVTVLGFNATNFGFEPVPGAGIIGTNLSTDTSGKADILATSSKPFSISVAPAGFIPRSDLVISPVANTANITIYDGGVTAFSGSVTLADLGTADVNITPTGGSSGVAIPARSVLAALTALDATSDTFDITDLSYNAGFASFIINCIKVPTSADSADCYNWTYAVNGVYPFVGVDDQILADGDSVVLFFGPSHQTEISKSSIILGDSFTATAEQYDLGSGNYIPLTGVTLGIGTANPDFSFTELATSTVDASGQAVFTPNATGTYAVGIKEDYYYPTASITITDVPVPAPEPAPNSGGGSSGVFYVAHRTFNLSSALQFLESKQKADGSFGANLYTDWAVIALASAEDRVGEAKRLEFLKKPDSALSSATDYERHAMALMSAGINPYSGTGVNYIQKILNYFDGTQVGETALVNDDIFALFPLLRAGYYEGDSIVQKIVSFIISKQNSNGSWENSVDMTAAAVQALSQTPTLPQVSASLAKARQYLKDSQRSDGGFGSSFSTSWAMQAIGALGENTTTWLKGDLSPEDSLYALQQTDGGVEPITADDNTRLWATSYAVPASLRKSWASILQSFTKPAVPTSFASGGGFSVTLIATSTTQLQATTTAEVASTSPVMLQATTTQATSTIAVASSTPIDVQTKASEGPDIRLLRVPEGGSQDTKTETLITKPTIKPVVKKIAQKVAETKVATIQNPKPTPVASVGALIPNTPKAQTATTLSLLAGILLIIALL